MFWVVMALIGGSWSTGSANPGLTILIFVAVGFVSVLWHELGHTFFQRKYGMMSRIHLYGMGGLAIPVGGRHPSRQEQMTISVMGPLFGLLLAGFTWILLRNVSIGNYWLAMALGFLLSVNLFWSVLNLLPVLPLDGGRIVEAFLGNRPNGTLLTNQIGMVVAGVAALAGMYFGWFIMAMMFGYFAYQSYQRTRRGF